MHILVTGGTGFVGHALVPALLADGHRLVLLTRRPGQRRGLDPRAALVGRLSDCGADFAPEAVINLAGEGIADRRWTAARRRELYDSRVTLTRELVHWLSTRATPPRVMLSGSAVGWYGDQGDATLTEASPPHPEYTHELCEAWEQAARDVAALGTRLCVLRTGVVLGPGGGMLARLLPVFRAGLGGRVGTGRQWLSWIGRQDLVEVMRRLLADEAMAGVYNATAPAPVTNGEFTRVLAAQLERPALLPVPAPALRLAHGELSSLLLGGQKVLPARLEAAGFRFGEATLAECLQRELA